MIKRRYGRLGAACVWRRDPTSPSIFSCLTALAFLGLLLLDDEKKKEERTRKGVRERVSEGEGGGGRGTRGEPASRLARGSSKEINARNRRDLRQEIEEKNIARERARRARS